MNVCVLVLGDAGRSPRMQYHCISLANELCVKSVTLVGVAGQRCVEDLESHPKVQKNLIAEDMTKGLSRKLFLIYAPVKIITQSFKLFFILMTIPNLDLILIQNPPCIPTFAVAGVVKLLRGTKIMIDWHNLGFTILAYSAGSVIVYVAKMYEVYLAYVFSDEHICVTKAMREWLLENVGMSSVTVQYDKPPVMFHRRTIEEQHQLFENISQPLMGRNVFTCERKGSCQSLADRPFILVSSTSWTPDEDFGVLLAALEVLDTDNILPRRILCIVTGQGPQKEMYLAKIQKMNMKQIDVRTMWLEAEDYPKLLGSADLGVCLHTSSSDLDLPMKVVDMFGSSLPVCAIGYSCLDELVLHQKNGMIFKDEIELAEQLLKLVNTKTGPILLEQFRMHIEKHFLASRWAENWKLNTGPLVKKLGKAPNVSVIVKLLILALLLFGSLFIKL